MKQVLVCINSIDHEDFHYDSRDGFFQAEVCTTLCELKNSFTWITRKIICGANLRNHYSYIYVITLPIPARYMPQNTTWLRLKTMMKDPKSMKDQMLITKPAFLKCQREIVTAMMTQKSCHLTCWWQRAWTNLAGSCSKIWRNQPTWFFHLSASQLLLPCSRLAPRGTLSNRWSLGYTLMEEPIPKMYQKVPFLSHMHSPLVSR